MTAEPGIWIFFLLLVAAAMGWLAARWSARPHRQRYSRIFSTEYLRGLNYLLNEQPDKAIEVFIKMVEADSDTVETHFALGSLFRRRGEVDRAIRIHQNLIARPNLSRAHRAQALFQLGEDYMRAGLLDRAESLFLELADSPQHTQTALNQLIAIYEQQKDWDQAIAIRRKLESATSEPQNEVIAQYYCELAQIALDTNDQRTARKHLKRAQSNHNGCIRADMLLGHMAMAESDYAVAYRHYRSILENDILFASEVLSPAAQALMKKNDSRELDRLLAQLKSRQPAAVSQIALAVILDPSIDTPVAQTCVREYLQTSPGLSGIYDMYTLFTGRSDVHGPEALKPVEAALRRLLENGPRYKCQQCGFTGKTLYWQCPSCKTWNNQKPFHDISFGQLALTENTDAT